MISKHTIKGISLSAKRISLLLTMIALLLWSHSILYARFDVGYFGLIHGLPITFFIALAFLTVASAILWVSRESHGRLLCLQLLILISALWLVPQITSGSPPFDNHAYRSLGLVEYIVRRGHFSAGEVWYLCWPGAIILLTIAAEVLSVDFEAILHFFPFLMQLLYLPLLYLFLKNTLGQTRGNYCWAGAWLFYVANWTGSEYFGSAPGIGLFFLLMLLVLATMPSVWGRSAKNFVLLFLMVCVFAALVITHLLTALAALCIMAALSLLKRNKRMVLAAGLCFLLMILWNLTGAFPHTKSTLASLDVMVPGETVEVPDKTIEVPGETVEVPDKTIEVPGETVEVPGETVEVPGETVEVPDKTIEVPGNPVLVGGRTIILDPDILVQGQIMSHLSGSESHRVVAKVRILFSAIFAVIGVIGVVMACLAKARRNIAISILAIALAPLVLLVIPYGGRMLDRLYLISLIPMAYFGARLLEIRKSTVVILLCLLLIISYPLLIISHYGNQAFDYFPQGYVDGLHFFHDRTANGHIIVLDAPWIMKNIENYRYTQVSRLEWQGRILLLPKKGQDGPYWAYVTRQDEAFYDFARGAPLFLESIEKALNNTVNCNLIYYNPDFKLYYLRPSVAH